MAGAWAVALAVRVIPCLDVDAGRVVKGTNFVDLVDAGASAVRASAGAGALYVEVCGAAPVLSPEQCERLDAVAAALDPDTKTAGLVPDDV